MDSAPLVSITNQGIDSFNKSFELKDNENIYILTISLK